MAVRGFSLSSTMDLYHLFCLLAFTVPDSHSRTSNHFTQLCSTKFNTKRKTPENQGFLVDATGFEPATSASRTQRSTKLSHASLFNSLFSTANSFIIHCHFSFVKSFFDFSRLFCNYSSRHSGFPHLTLLYRPLRAIRPLRIRHLFM